MKNKTSSSVFSLVILEFQGAKGLKKLFHFSKDTICKLHSH